MDNKTNKPKFTSHQLVKKMEIEKGIQFKYTSEAEAENYLSNINNYLRTAAYRKNFQYYRNGPNIGKYIHLDFAYLQELSTIDMHFRFLISKMCLDIEHDLKVQLLKNVENDPTTDGYDIVEQFLSQNTFIINKLESTSSSPFTGDLLHKYFTITRQAHLNRIKAFDDCPVWVLLELLTFGDFIHFYAFYYSSRGLSHLSKSVVNLVKSLRNGTAHNNCILADLSHGTSHVPPEISQAISHIATIHSNQRRKKLSCRPMLEFTTLLYVYKLVVSDKVKYYRIIELKNLFFVRMPEKKNFFKNNQLLKSNYDFACKVISAFF